MAMAVVVMAAVMVEMAAVMVVMAMAQVVTVSTEASVVDVKAMVVKVMASEVEVEVEVKVEVVVEMAEAGQAGVVVAVVVMAVNKVIAREVEVEVEMEADVGVELAEVVLVMAVQASEVEVKVMVVKVVKVMAREVEVKVMASWRILRTRAHKVEWRLAPAMIDARVPPWRTDVQSRRFPGLAPPPTCHLAGTCSTWCMGCTCRSHTRWEEEHRQLERQRLPWPAPQNPSMAAEPCPPAPFRTAHATSCPPLHTPAVGPNCACARDGLRHTTWRR